MEDFYDIDPESGKLSPEALEYLARLKKRKQFERWTEDPAFLPERARPTEAYPYGSEDFSDYLKFIEVDDGEDEEGERVLKAYPYPKVFYHITPTRRLKMILREGLKVGKTRTLGSGRVSPRYGLYLGENLEDLVRAMFNTSSLKSESRIKNFTALRVIVPEGTPIGEDPEFSVDSEGLGYWVIFGDIPPENIEVVRSFKI